MSQVNARLVYRNALTKMKQAGVNPATAILSQSYLRFEVLASATKTQYQFGVLVNDAPSGATQRPTEQRLNLQDAFYTSSVQIFTSLASSSTATNFSLDSYPNPRKYSDANVAQGMYNLYNGYLSLTVNNRVITPSWDLYRHVDIPQTQQNNLTSVTGYTLDELAGDKTSAVACEPNWVLIGSKNNQLTLNLPSAMAPLQTTSSPSTVIVCILRGVLAQNVTVVS
jgi:hypothetical protein